MRNYPSYRLEDFHQKRFLEGGITSKQMFFLYRSADAERYNYYRFLGALQGVDIDASKEKPTQTTSIKTQGDKQFLFQAPEDYEKMTDEERKLKTDKMMEHWKGFQLKTSPKQ